VSAPAAAAPLARHLAGDGAPVVLLNGGLMTWAAWEPVAAPLGRRHAVLRFDFRGQLATPAPRADGVPTDLAGHAADVAALLDEVGWGAAHLVGTSFGAEVAIELAASRPERARSLVLVTAADRSTPGFDEQSAELHRLVADVLAGGDRGRFHDAVVERVYSAGWREANAGALAARRAAMGQLPASWFAGAGRLVAAVEGFDLRQRLAEVRCPASVVAAADDRVFGTAPSHALAAALGAGLEIHPTSGHALVGEDPGWLVGVVLDFLAGFEEAPEARREAGR